MWLQKLIVLFTKHYIIIFNEIKNDSLFILHALAFLDLLFIRPLLSSAPSIICTVY